MLHIKLAQFAVRGALPPRRSESPVCANDNKPSCELHLLGWFIGSRGFSSLERRPEFWVLQNEPEWLCGYTPGRNSLQEAPTLLLTSWVLKSHVSGGYSHSSPPPTIASPGTEAEMKMTLRDSAHQRATTTFEGQESRSDVELRQVLWGAT